MKTLLWLDDQRNPLEDNWLNACRYVYNMALEIKDAWYKKRGVSISKGELQKQITDIRKDFDWIKDVQIHTLQDVTDRLFRAYDNFFRRIKEIILRHREDKLKGIK